MGLGLNRQQNLYSNFSSGLISIGNSTDDPSNLITNNGNGTISINFGGKYKIVDRVNTANNRYYTSRSRILSWKPVADLDHTSIGSDGNFIIVVDDAETISIIQLSSNQALLPVYSDTEPNQNTHIQIGNFVKSGGAIISSTIEVAQLVNNNTPNRLNNIAQTIGTVNSIVSPIEISPITSSIQIATTQGRAFVPRSGFAQTKGINPDQFTTNASSPTLIILITRDNLIQGQSFNVNVNDYESSPGIITAKSNSRVTNNFILAFAQFNVQLLGQIEFSGADRLQDASEFSEELDLPELVLAGAKISKVSIEQGATDLTNSSEAIFRDLEQFR